MPSSRDIRAYIDETGDRGSGTNSSPIFGMAAVLVDDIGALALRSAVNQLRVDLKVPASKPMSWKESLKNHDRRRHAATVLGQIPSEHLKVCYVFATKSELRPDSYVCDPQRFYNYIAFTMYKAVIWAAKNWGGDEPVRLWTRFGHVRNHDHSITEQYIRTEALADPRVAEHLEQGLKWVSADKYLESQAADIYGGFLKSAVWPGGEFGMTEPSYLLSIWHQIRNSGDCASPLGIMSMPRSDILHNMDWFPCHECPKKTPPTQQAP